MGPQCGIVWAQSPLSMLGLTFKKRNRFRVARRRLLRSGIASEFHIVAVKGECSMHGEGFDAGTPSGRAGSLSFCGFQRLLDFFVGGAFVGLSASFPAIPALF